MSMLIPPRGHDAATVADALTVAEEIASRDRSNLYRTSQFFEDRARYDAFIAMYAVMRVVDDFVDDVLDKARLTEAERRRLTCELDAWEGRIRDAYDGNPRDASLDIALAAAVATFPVPIQHWLAFLEAMRFDVRKSRFDDFAEFLRYGEGATVAPTAIYVYLLASRRQADGRYLVRDFDYAGCARDLGRFAYVAHVLRDVRKDLAVGETGLVYLSTADLRDHRLTESDLRDLVAGRATAMTRTHWRALVHGICARAKTMRSQGDARADHAWSGMPIDCAFIFRLIVDVYAELLDRIDADPERVLGDEPLLSDTDRSEIFVHAAEATGYALADAADRCERQNT